MTQVKNDLSLHQTYGTPMKLIYTLILLCCVGSASWAQNLIRGTVSDSKTGELIIGAVIRNKEGNGAVTDLNGVFTINSNTPNDTLRITMIGYEEFKHAVRPSDINNPLVIQLRPSENQLHVVVVSAGKFAQDVSEVTVSMEVLSPELLRDKNVPSADEILQQTPGVSIVDKEPQIRSGSGYSFGAGSRVQILVDDLPSLSGDAGRPSWDYIPVENISQIEVIKGASSVLYGSAALSGVINVRTAYPSDTARTIVNVYHGMYSTPQNDSSVYWNSPLMRSGINFLHSQKFGQLDFVIGGNAIGDDGHLGPIRDTASGSFVDKYDPFSADRYEANSRARLNMNLRYRSKNITGLSYGLNTNWNVSNSLATLLWAQADTGLYAAYEGSATRTKQLLGTIDPFITYYNSKGNKHSLRTRWQTLDNDNDNNQGNFSDQYFGEYQYQLNWENLGIRNMTTTLGAVVMHTDARGQLFTGGNPDGRNRADNYAGYFQVDKKFLEKLNVSAGVRYEYFEINKASDSKPVFRAGLNYQAARATYIRASYGQGYRFPSIAEKFIVTGVGAINIFANPDLVAETSYNAEIGVRQGFRIGQFLGFADVAVFQQEYDNFIEFTFGQWQRIPSLAELNFDLDAWADTIESSIGFKSVNTGHAKIQGLEFSLMGEGKIRKVKTQVLAGYTYTLPISTTPNYSYGTPQNGSNPELKIPGHYTYNTTSSDTTNNILKYRMQHLIRADLSFTYKNIMLGLSGRYNSHMQNIDRAFEDLESSEIANFNPGIRNWRKEHTSGDYVFDVRIGYTFAGKHRVSLIMNNVLNREYAIRPLAIEQPRFTMIQYVLNL
jgi:outer membrane receptor protein involved in Fe transport